MMAKAVCGELNIRPFKESVNSTLDDFDSQMNEMGYNIILTSSTGARLGVDGTSTLSITLTKKWYRCNKRMVRKSL